MKNVLNEQQKQTLKNMQMNQGMMGGGMMQNGMMQNSGDQHGVMDDDD